MNHSDFNEKAVAWFYARDGAANYREIKKAFPETSRPDYHLGLSVEEGILRRLPGRGNYSLALKAIINYRRDKGIILPLAVIGGKNFEATLKPLQGLVLIKKYVSLIIGEAEKELKESFEGIPIQNVLSSGNDPEKIFQSLKGILEDLIWDYQILIDVSSEPIVLVISLMELANKYGVRKVYEGKVVFR